MLRRRRKDLSRCVYLFTSSTLEWIGVSYFNESEVEDVSIHDDVRELRGGCFKGCSNLTV